MISCKICGGATSNAFSALILRKFTAPFYACDKCGFLQTPEPDWLKDAYSDAVVVADTGLVRRNYDVSKKTSVLICCFFSRKGRFRDVAGGYGLFVRLMRDVGFDFFWSDKYCQNLLARGFEAQTGYRYSLVTAFEVLEHVPDPLGFIRDALQSSGSNSILFTTELFSGSPPKPGEWWYYAFEAGQHISFYQRRTLQEIANRLGKRLYSRGSLHLLTDVKIHPWIFSLITGRTCSQILFLLLTLGMKSRTIDDHQQLVSRQNENSV